LRAEFDRVQQRLNDFNSGNQNQNQNRGPVQDLVQDLVQQRLLGSPAFLPSEGLDESDAGSIDLFGGDGDRVVQARDINNIPLDDEDDIQSNPDLTLDEEQVVQARDINNIPSDDEDDVESHFDLTFDDEDVVASGEPPLPTNTRSNGIDSLRLSRDQRRLNGYDSIFRGFDHREQNSGADTVATAGTRFNAATEFLDHIGVNTVLPHLFIKGNRKAPFGPARGVVDRLNADLGLKLLDKNLRRQDEGAGKPAPAMPTLPPEKLDRTPWRSQQDRPTAFGLNPVRTGAPETPTQVRTPQARAGFSFGRWQTEAGAPSHTPPTFSRTSSVRSEASVVDDPIITSRYSRAQLPPGKRFANSETRTSDSGNESSSPSFVFAQGVLSPPPLNSRKASTDEEFAAVFARIRPQGLAT
jgi:hypothetical protein